MYGAARLRAPIVLAALQPPVQIPGGLEKELDSSSDAKDKKLKPLVLDRKCSQPTYGMEHGRSKRLPHNDNYVPAQVPFYLALAGPLGCYQSVRIQVQNPS